jgi:hypothetical protein
VAKETVVYIQNVGDHGIKAHSADGKLVKRFECVQYNDLTGRPTHNGYTPLSMTEYATLLRESKVFSHFLDLKMLAKHDALPEDAMSPHDALVSAKRESAEYAQLIAEMEAVKQELERRLAAAEGSNKALESRLAAAEAAKGKKE